MRDNKRLRSLVLDTNPHSPVSYFKVLRTLGIFSDSVRATYGYLETLSQTAQKPWVSDIWLESSPWRSDIWLESSYPHTNETRRILAHNWNSVLRHQEEASNIVLKRLERTTNEVQGLMDGVREWHPRMADKRSADTHWKQLFSVQTVTEAQKSRMLNKYILVFTIITIIFLPPTFVSVSYSTSL